MGQLVKAVLVVLFMISGSCRAAAPDDQPFETIQGQLDRRAVLRADFHQERHLEILKRPLQSSGTMLLLRDEGVLWRVTEPYEVTYLIRADEILEWEGGNGPRRVGMTAVPAFRLMTEMFLAALGGNLSSLRENFSAETLPAETGWRVRLLPAVETLAQVIASLEVAGDSYVREVLLKEVRGDSMSFTFSNLDADPAGPDEAERSYFAH